MNKVQDSIKENVHVPARDLTPTKQVWSLSSLVAEQDAFQYKHFSALTLPLVKAKSRNLTSMLNSHQQSHLTRTRIMHMHLHMVWREPIVTFHHFE